ELDLSSPFEPAVVTRVSASLFGALTRRSSYSRARQCSYRSAVLIMTVFVFRLQALRLVCALLMLPGFARAQSEVTGKVDFAVDTKTANTSPSREAVIWLTP